MPAAKRQMNYDQALEFIAKGKDKNSRRYSPICTLWQEPDHIAVQLHATDIVKLYPNGDVQLYTGGWETSTTKAYMNAFLPACVYVFQKEFSWYVNIGTMEVLDFEENMVINANMTVGLKV